MQLFTHTHTRSRAVPVYLSLFSEYLGESLLVYLPPQVLFTVLGWVPLAASLPAIAEFHLKLIEFPINSLVHGARWSHSLRRSHRCVVCRLATTLLDPAHSPIYNTIFIDPTNLCRR